MYRFYEEYHQKSTHGLVQGDCKQTSVGTEGFVLKNWEADRNTYSDFESIHPPEVQFKMTKYCSKLTSSFFVWRTRNVLLLRLAYCTSIWCLRCMYTPLPPPKKKTPSSCVSIVFWDLKVQRHSSPSINHPIHTYYTPKELESPTRGLPVHVCCVYVAQVCATRAAKELPLTPSDNIDQSVSFSGNNDNTRRPFSYPRQF